MALKDSIVYMFNKPPHAHNTRRASHNFIPIRSKLKNRRFRPILNCFR